MARPNILFAFADQMRGQDMGCAGNPDVITPTFDRLAREGAFCPGHYAACPLCSPNRATMLTGTWPTRHRLLFNDTAVRTDLPGLGTVARDNGYRCGYIGKWHIDGGPRDRFIPPGPRRLGFDDYWAVRNCGHDYFETQFHRDTPGIVRMPGYEPEVQTDLAVDEFLADGDDRPFCLVLSWGPPHNPYEQVPDRYREMYDGREIRFRGNCEEIPEACLDPAWSHAPTTRDYYAQITSLDECLGRLLRALESAGVLDDTIVVFSSDHGDMMWSQGLLYKCVPYEESLRVPLLVRYPEAVPARTRIDAPTGSADLFPTLCALAGWEIPETSQGRDLSAALRGEPDAPTPDRAPSANFRPYVFRPDAPTPEWRAVRTGRYTYAATPDRQCWMLFDNDADPLQQENLARSAAHADVRAELAARLDDDLAALGDPFLPAQEMEMRFPSLQHPEPTTP